MKKTVARILLVCSLVVACVAVVGCSGGASSSASSSASSDSSEKLSVTSESASTLVNINGETVSADPTGIKNILIIGDDAWENYTPGHADMMCLMRVDFDNHDVTLVTVPRDTKCWFPEDNGWGKLNYRYTGYGPEDQAKNVTSITGLPVDFYVIIGLNEFTALVDSFGGIEANLPYGLWYEFYTKDFPREEYEAGEQTLTGWRAMALSRARNGYEDSGIVAIDYCRQWMDRQMLTTLMQYAYSSNQGIDALFPVLQQYIKTDIPVDVQIAWAQKLGENGTIKVTGTTGPYIGDYDEEAGGQWLVKSDPDGWANMTEAVLNRGDLQAAYDSFSKHEDISRMPPVVETTIKTK